MVYITTEDMRFPLPDIGCTPDTDTGTENPPVSGGGSQLPVDSIRPSLLSLAMGFVPVQSWEEPYENDLALARGTIFPSLDKPFLGEEAVAR